LLERSAARKCNDKERWSKVRSAFADFVKDVQEISIEWPVSKFDLSLKDGQLFIKGIEPAIATA